MPEDFAENLVVTRSQVHISPRFTVSGGRMKRIVVLLFVASCFAATSSYAQQAPRRGAGGGGQQQSTSREDGLDPTPVDPKVDPNVDMWINDYRNAKPRTVYGNLVFRDILTRLDGADKLHPVKKGAVISAISR